MKAVFLFLQLILISGQSFSQFNKIREEDILYREKIVRTINLNYSLNENLFGKDNQLVQVLLDAYKKDELIGYKSEDLNEVLSKDDYNAKINVKLNDCDTFQYSVSQLYKIEIFENLIFDRNRSEIVFDMEAITIFIPAEINYRQILEPVVSFNYDDCEKIFRNDKRAIAMNPLRNGRNINYAEVFLLRLFQSDIVKIGNNLYFDQMYADPTMAYVARKDAENKLTEYLYKLFNPK